MRKFLFALAGTALLLLFYPNKVHALYDPRTEPNNKFGIHVASMNDLRDAESLVNSSGGNWGYITFVIQDGERNKDYWQYIFNEMRKMRLIPIVRIASHAEQDYWVKPKKEEIASWVNFLNSLNWVTENRYVVIGNEPNHSKEWGLSVNPEEYADYLISFSDQLKASSSDFFVLPAGLDLSAPNSKSTLDASTFISRVKSYRPDFFDKIDGWTSHSYPNPDFTGGVSDSGRKSIRGYLWEQDYLKSIGVNNDYPIFITETGWAKYTKKTNRYTKILSEDLIASYYMEAFSNVWNDKNIVAITPFVLNYQEPPFDVFSWKSQSGFYSYYQRIKELSKISGNPKIHDAIKIRANYVFPFPDKDNNFKGVLIVENIGQSIVQSKDLALKSNMGLSSLMTGTTFDQIEPFDTGAISYTLYISDKNTEYYSFVIYKQGEFISDQVEVRLNTLKTAEMKLEWFFGKIRSILGL